MTVNVAIGTYRQTATLSAPGTPSADGDGGYTQTYAALSPATWRCAIEPASASVAKRHFAATLIAEATHVLRGRFHAGITTKTRFVWVDRNGDTHTANGLGFTDPEGAGVETIALVTEVVS